jgi:TolB protein
MKNKIPVILLVLLLLACIPMIMADSDSQNNNSNTGKIAFASKRSGNSEIYTIQADGSGLTRLTNNKSEDFMPQWSPDGTKIFYISANKGKNEIWVMNADGSDPIRVAEDSYREYPPSWSPDSRKILLSLRPGVWEYVICTVDADGDNFQRISDSNAKCKFPSWSPDGSKIVYVNEYQGEIYIYTMNVDGTERIKLTREEGTYERPTWSPDGRKIGFVFTKKSLLAVDPVIGVVNADGTGQLTITKGDYEFYWSPNSKMIAFTKVGDKKINYRPGHAPEIIKYYGLYIISMDGNGYDTKVNLTGLDRTFPAWTLDSAKVIYMYDSKLNIYTTRNRNNIDLAINSSLSAPRISPDGTQILWAGGKAGILKKSYLYIAKTDGTAVTKLTDSGSDSDPVWQPVISQ